MTAGDPRPARSPQPGSANTEHTTRLNDIGNGHVHAGNSRPRQTVNVAPNRSMKICRVRSASLEFREDREIGDPSPRGDRFAFAGNDLEPVRPLEGQLRRTLIAKPVWQLPAMGLAENPHPGPPIE